MPFDINGALQAGYSPSDVAGFLAQNPDQSPIDVQGARKAGYSDQEILSQITPGPSIGSQVLGALDHLVPPSVDRGIAQAGAGLADTADIAGAHGVAAAIRSHLDQKALNAPTSFHALTGAIRSGNVGGALSAIPGAVGEALPQLAGTIASGIGGAALGSAIGPEGTAAGAIGGIAAPALLTVAQQAGTIAKARAAADGRATPNDADIATAVGSSAVLGLLDKVGLGEAAGGLLTRAVKTILSHGAATAAQNVGQQAAQTAGTQQGLTVDPAQAAAAAAQGVATRGALGAGRMAVDSVQGLTPAARQAALAGKFTDMTPEDQQNAANQASAAQAIKDTQAAAVDNPADARPSAAARTAAQDIFNSFQGLKAKLVADGSLEPDGAKTFTDLLGIANNSQRALTTDHLQDLQALGLDQPTTDLIANGLQRLNMLKDAGVANRNQSLLGKIGSKAGAIAGFGLGSSLGHPIVGASIGSNIGSALGNKLANVLGVSQSPLLKAGTAAASMMTAAGQAIPDTKAQIRSAIDQQHDAVASLANQLGLKATTDQVQAQAATARAQAAQEVANQNVAQGQQATAIQQPLADVQTTAALRTQMGGQMAANAAEMARQGQPYEPPGPGTMQVPMSASMQATGTRLAPWMYALGAGLQGELNASGMAKNIDIPAEVTGAVQEALNRGWFDGTAIPGQQIASALLAHRGTLQGTAFKALQNLMLASHGINRLDPTAMSQGAPAALAQAAE